MQEEKNSLPFVFSHPIEQTVYYSLLVNLVTLFYGMVPASIKNYRAKTPKKGRLRLKLKKILKISVFFSGIVKPSHETQSLIYHPLL